MWAVTARGFTFPNLFTILIGRPGIGKTEAISRVRSLIQATFADGIYNMACNLAPVDVTKAALLDYLASAKVKRQAVDPEALALNIQDIGDYHSAFLAVSELGDLVRNHDTELLNILHSLYDCLPMIQEERRYRADNPIKIPRPQISLLGGTTPAYVSRTFPVQAWDEGFMARTILIYSNDLIEPDLFGSDTTELDEDLAKQLVDDLRQVSKIQGRFEFSEDCKMAMVSWQKSGRKPQPTHPRLEHYNTRRMRHAIKLSMIASANRSNDLRIEVVDFQEALNWMIEAETAMPGMFMEMVGKSDSQVLNELWVFVKGLWEAPMTKGRSVRRGLLVNFLKDKVPANQIDKIIDIAVDGEILVKVASTSGDSRYKPGDAPSLFRAKKV